MTKVLIKFISIFAIFSLVSSKQQLFKFNLLKSRLDSAPVSRLDERALQFLPMTKCGESNYQGDRIVNGRMADIGQFPWMVRICYRDELGIRDVGCLCGGSLISPLYVLTAAHCVTTLSKPIIPWEVHLGEHDTRNDPDCEGGVCSPPIQRVKVKTMIPHKEWSKANSMNDIALLRLEHPVDLHHPCVQPVCLPLGELQFRNLELEKILFAAGWGRNENGVPSPVLQFATVPPVPRTTCTMAYKFRRVIAPSQICAGGGMQDSCNGDSGGPLMLPMTDDSGSKFVQVGLVSFGPSLCGTVGVPGVYTRVGFYLNWILQNMDYHK